MKPGKDYIGVGVGAFILNDKNELLMLLRSENCKNEHNTWMIPGGSIDFNDTMEDTIIREVKEEIGVDVEIVEALSTINHILPAEGQHWITTSFRCRIKEGEPKIMEHHKHADLKWFSLDEMPENLSEATRITLEKYKK